MSSIVINPKTSVEKIFPHLHLIDQVVLMSVEPGFSGQRFLPNVIDKIEPLVNYQKSHHLNFRIAFDGGVSLDNISMLAHKGVTDFAIASAIFKQQNPVTALEELRNKVQ